MIQHKVKPAAKPPTEGIAQSGGAENPAMAEPGRTGDPPGAGRGRISRSLSLAALFAALTAAGTFIAIPLPFSPVPVVLQNFFSLLAGLVLGPGLGSAAVGLYLAAGIIGAPIFAGAGGGISRLLGPTGGFLLGYLLSALVAGCIAGPPQRRAARSRIILAVLAGLLVVYVPGLIRLRFAVGSWGKALVAGLVPFIAGDAVKGVMAVLIAPRLRRPLADRFDA